MSAKQAAVEAGVCERSEQEESLSPPPTQSSLSFCAGVQFSRDSIRAFNNRKKYEQIEGCKQPSPEKDIKRTRKQTSEVR